MFYFQASRKKEMIAKGLLDKLGKPNDKTPHNWRNTYTDYK